MNKYNLPKTFAEGNGFFKRTKAEQNSSSILTVDDLSITADENKSILCSKMPVTPATVISKVNVLQPTARMNRQPNFTTTLAYSKPHGNIRTSQIGNKLNDLDFGVTSTPLHGRVSLRQKFIDEQLSPIMQEFNGGRRSLQSRIPVPQNRLLGPVVGGTKSQSKKPLYTKFNQDNKEPNPPMISRSEQRVSFESHVIAISNMQHASVISNSNSRVIAMKMCQETVTVKRNTNTKGNLKCNYSLAPVVDIPSLNNGPNSGKVNSNCAISASKNTKRANMMKIAEEKEYNIAGYTVAENQLNAQDYVQKEPSQQLIGNKSTSLHFVNDRFICQQPTNNMIESQSRPRVSVSGDKSKSILKKPHFRQNVLVEEEDDDDDIFGMSKCMKHKLTTVNSGTMCEDDSDKQLHQSGDKKISPAVKRQKYIDNEKGLKERSPNIMEGIFSKTENDIQQLTDSKKINKKVTDKKLKCSHLNSLKSTVKNDNHQFDNKQDKNSVYEFEISKNHGIVSHAEKKPKGRKRQNDKDVENQNSDTEKYNDALKNIEQIYRTDLNPSTKKEQNLTNTNSVERLISSNMKKELVKKTDVSEAKQIVQALKSNKGRKKTASKKDSVQVIEDKIEDIKFKSESNNIDIGDEDDGVFKTKGKGANGKTKNLKGSEVNTIKGNKSESTGSSKMEKEIITTSKVAKRGPRSKIIKITEILHDVKQNPNEELKDNTEYNGENQNVAVHTYTTKPRKVKDRKVNNNIVDDNYKEKLITQDNSDLEGDVNKAVMYTTIKRTKRKVPPVYEAVNLNSIPVNESDKNVQEQDVPKKVQSKLKGKVNEEVEPAVKGKEVATIIQVDKINESVEDVIKEQDVPNKIRTKLKSKINEEVKSLVKGKEIEAIVHVDMFKKETIEDVLKKRDVPKKCQSKLISKVNEEVKTAVKGEEVATIQVDKIKESVEDVKKEQGVPKKVQTKLKSKINEDVGSLVKGKESLHVDMVKETIEDVIAHYGFKDENKLKKYSFHTKEQKNKTENKGEKISEKNKLELSRKRLITNEASTIIVEKKKRRITVLDCNDEEKANDVESSQGSRRSSRKHSKTTDYFHDSSSLLIHHSQNSIKTEKGTACFSSVIPRLKPVCSGVKKSTGIIVNNTTSGGHIFIQPGNFYENVSSNNNMFVVQKGPALVKIYKTSKVVEVNNFFFVPSNVPFKVKNPGPKKVVLCFVKTIPKT